jgi:hypothetical protein
LRRSFATGRTSTIVTHADAPTAITKVGDQLYWEQFATRPCRNDNYPSTIMTLSLATKKPKATAFLRCLSSSDGVVAEHGFLYFAESNGIGRIGLDHHQLKRRYIPLTTQPEGDSLDGLASNGTDLYFSRCDDDGIGRVALDGSDLSYNFLQTGHKSCPQALAIGNGHIYWSDLNPIGRARLDGTKVQRSWQSIRSGQGPYFLAADQRHVYWSWGGAASTPSYVGRVGTDHRHFTKRWASGQGAFLLTTPGSAT